MTVTNYNLQLCDDALSRVVTSDVAHRANCHTAEQVGQVYAAAKAVLM